MFYSQKSVSIINKYKSIKLESCKVTQVRLQTIHVFLSETACKNNSNL